MKGMLSGNHLTQLVQKGFAELKDTKKRKGGIALADCLMSAYAMFSLKYPSLLQFDRHHHDEEKIKYNLQNIYNIERIPCDTQMRERLDEVQTSSLRKLYTRLFTQCQRSKQLELFEYLDGRYLMAIDGTGYFHSNDVHCDNCCVKHHRDGSVSYYHQMLSGVIVHPKHSVVLPFAPEPIMKTDGTKKNDCERRSAERFLSDLKREHPHLKLIITGDGLFSNGPYIKRLKADDHRFILVAKEKDHKALFEEFNALKTETSTQASDKVTHHFEWLNGLSINDTHTDCLVNVLSFREERSNGKCTKWVWVTDILLCKENVYQIMRGGRARHKIENETFNTLKNQGYQLEHNFGHGKNQLSSVFAFLMQLAFFVDQLQQLNCKTFKKALIKLRTKMDLWERQRALFSTYFVDSFEDLWLSLAHGPKPVRLCPDTS